MRWILRWTAFAFFAQLASACTSEDEVPTSSSEDHLDARCDDALQSVGISKDGACTGFAGKGGRWSSSPLFADAPTGSGACRYTWSSKKHARAYFAALNKHIASFTYTPGCDTDTDAGAASLQPIPELSDGGQGQGAVGCDVCGVQRDGKIWVVLPPLNVHFRQVQVPLTNGSQGNFQISGAFASWMTLALPPAPDGTSYVDGPVYVQ